MTFKHEKFEDSVTMRSLVKVAANKGWIKPEPMVKQASATDDLTPTRNLTENVMKLSSALRKSGMVKAAEELEHNFITYKHANSLYNISDESGEDLVDAAHPNKSHKIKDIEGDSVIETIIDQQLKDLKIVNKKPTGKLSSSKEVLNAVKVVLAQELSDVPDSTLSMTEEQLDPWRRRGAMLQLKLIPSILEKVYHIVHGKMNTTTLASAFDKNFKEINSTIESLNESNVSVEKVDEVLSDLSDIENSVKFFNWKDLGLLNPFTAPFSAARHVGDVTDMVTGNWDQELRDQILELVNKANLAGSTARNNLRGNNDAAIKKALSKMKSNQQLDQKKNDEPKVALNSSIAKIREAQRSLNNISALVSADTDADPADIRDINAWIAKQNAVLSKLESQAFNLDTDVVDRILSKITKDVEKAKQQWV